MRGKRKGAKDTKPRFRRTKAEIAAGMTNDQAMKARRAGRGVKLERDDSDSDTMNWRLLRRPRGRQSILGSSRSDNNDESGVGNGFETKITVAISKINGEIHVLVKSGEFTPPGNPLAIFTYQDIYPPSRSRLAELIIKLRSFAESSLKP